LTLINLPDLGGATTVLSFCPHVANSQALEKS
jgi:hypothetical protein